MIDLHITKWYSGMLFVDLNDFCKFDIDSKFCPILKIFRTVVGP